MNELVGKALRRTEKKMNVTALICIALLFGMIFLSLPYGIGIVDEPFYYATAQRVLQGDRLLVDEWQVSQLFSLLLVIPVKLHMLIFGSTEGLILNMRYLYAACEFVLGLYLWKKLKQYGYSALFFVLAVCSFGPMYSFSYYNVTVNGTALICALLFAAAAPPKRYQLIFAGTVAAAVVLAEPLLALLYVVFTFLVIFFAIKKKRKGSDTSFLFRPSTWCFLTLGILLIAIPFFLYYLSSLNWDLAPLFENLVGLASDSDHEIKILNILYPLAKIYFATQLTGPVLTVLAVLTVLVSAFVRLRKIENQKLRGYLFFFAVGLYCLSYLYSLHFLFFTEGMRFLYHYNFRGYAVPIMFLGLVCLLLSDDVKPMERGFWCAGFLVSYLQDVNSQTGYGSSAVICLLPSSVLFFRLFRRYYRSIKASAGSVSDADVSGTKNKAEKKKTHALPAAVRRWCSGGRVKQYAAICLCSCVVGISVFWVGQNLYVRMLLPRYERWEMPKTEWQPLDTTVAEGPLKGIRTTETIAGNYQEQMADMAYLMEKGRGDLYVTLFCPLPYLYTDFPMGTYSSCYVDEDIPARPLLYWRLHPDRVPEYIYVPFCSGAYAPAEQAWINETLERIDRFFDCTKEERPGGYIVYVNGVRTLEDS